MKLPTLLSPSPGRFVYLLGDEGAVLVYIEKDVVIRRLFAPTPAPEHTNTFIELLRSHPKSPIYVLVDMIDQSYIRHTLPPVTPLGVGKLVQRRLDRDFSKDDIKGALSLGREKEGRKDWNFLLISLANSAILQSWLNLVIELPNFFAGIFLVPVETENIVKDLDVLLGNNESAKKKKDKKTKSKVNKKDRPSESEEALAAEEATLKQARIAAGDENKEFSEWKIFVTHNKVGGFRQVVLRSGKLVFTRLAQTMDNTNPEVLAGSVEQEIQNTIEYLKRLGFTPRNGLDIYITCSQEVKDSISKDKLGATNVFLFSPFEIGEMLGLKQAVLSGDRFGDIVIATAFGLMKKKRLQLNIPYTQNIEKFEKYRKIGKIGGALGSVALILLSLLAVVDYAGIKGEISTKQQEKTARTGELAKIQEDSKKLPADVDQVTDLISLYDLVSITEPSPLSFIGSLHDQLEEGITVKSLLWQRKEVQATPNPSNPTPDPALPPSAMPRKDQFTITTEFDVTFTDKAWEDFTARSVAFIAKLKKAYPLYDFKVEGMPGDLPETPGGAQVSFEDLKKTSNKPLRGQTFTISVQMVGPKEAPPAPDATSTPAPPPVQ